MKNIIKIHLHEKSNYKNEYNENILSYQLSNYILEETKGIDTKEKIEFAVQSDFKMSEVEKNNLVDMMRNNFGADISEIMHIAKKQRMIYYIILIISIVLIILYSLFKINILSEFVLIFGWVLLGEAICNFLYKGIENNHKISRRKQIVNAKIYFE